MKFKYLRHILAVTMIAGGIFAADSAAVPNRLVKKAALAFEEFRPGVSGFKAVTIKQASSDPKTRTVTLRCS
ncbi:MAG: hypothetical protein K1V78_01145, partial [Muribaculaceae bacterium]